MNSFKNHEIPGLTSAEVIEQQKKYGLNTLPEEKHNPFLLLLQKFWAPIPWMLEIIIILELILGKFTEAWIVGLLILFNASFSFFQESKAKKTLILLRKQLQVQARVLRDQEWKILPAMNLVPEDMIRIRMGDIIPADIKILQGHVLIDQSVLTGESFPIELEVGKILYAGSTVKHGEAIAQVLSTGKNTFFGKTAEIMVKEKTPSHLQKIIFSIVKVLVTFDVFLIIALLGYAFIQHIPFTEIIPFSLLLLVASVPVALPATYTLATALGAMELAKVGVLTTRLSALEEAAAINVLCLDKTGTITENRLAISALLPYSPYSENDLLCLAALASEESTQDPLDLAILKSARQCHSKFSSVQRKQFIPFDPSKKCSEAIIDHDAHILKGSAAELIKLCQEQKKLLQDLEKFSLDGSRVIAVVFGKNDSYDLVGLIGLQDPPRKDSKEAIRKFNDLGVRVMMITGDGIETARFIASQVGIGPKIISQEDFQRLPKDHIIENDVISGVFPEDKFTIVQELQNKKYICGMTGDGVNDAPALKKAEVGIATSNATDVAKAAASLVLTNQGLEDIVEAIKTSRKIFQRMLTYTLNKIIKTLEISVLLGLGLLITHQFIISQLLIVLLLFANDFVTMSISTDRVSFSKNPDAWQIKSLMTTGGIFATLMLIFSFFILFTGYQFLHLSLPELQTWIFLTLVFTGQATVYLVRERSHFWHSRPSIWMISATLLDLCLISSMAFKGFLMAPLAIHLILGLFLAIAIFFVVLDFFKVWIFSKFAKI